MNATMNLPMWECPSPDRFPDCSYELDDIIERLAAGDKTVPELDSPIPMLTNSPVKVQSTEKQAVVNGEKVEESGTVVCGIDSAQRVERLLREARPINSSDVTLEACSTRICSAGSYSRRVHSKQKDRISPPPPTLTEPPKINPIFVWARHNDNQIVELMCEDYDARNRIRLTKTTLGWLAIPKSKILSTVVIPQPRKIKRKRRKKSKKKKRSKDEILKENCDSAEKENSQQSDELSLEAKVRESLSDDELKELDKPSRSFIKKSASCEFTKLIKTNLPRSSSLNISLTLNECEPVQVPPSQSQAVDLGLKVDPDETPANKNLNEKGESDFSDHECDVLGMLLNEIPNLEFAEEPSEFEELTLPTDLTLPKSKTDEEPPKLTLPNISPLVTVTSSTRPPQPLTAPLPEVTITPIPNPRPAHQNNPQNKYLEALLSTPQQRSSTKPDKDEVTITRMPNKGVKRKSEQDMKAKCAKIEDISLRALLAKQSEERLKEKAERCRLNATSTAVDPIAQLKQVLSNPDLAVPDPLLVPRARLPALVASPASEIPRLLMENKLSEKPKPMPPDSDTLFVSLSHLRSLLSYRASDKDDLSAYQKSLETFLEWQRYQTGLMEAQIKATPPLTPTDIDVATANAFNQMLWLPYLNQMDTNREFVNLMCSPYGQSSPFLTPTSPIDMESQVKSFTLWQDALFNQPTSAVHQPAHVPRSPRKRVPVSQYNEIMQHRSQLDHIRNQQYEYHRKQLLHQRNLERQRQQERQKLLHFMAQDEPRQVHMDSEKKPRPGLIPIKQHKKSNWHQFADDIHKSAEITNQMALQWEQFEEEMRRSQIQISKNQRKIKSELLSPPCERDEKVKPPPVSGEQPKLKVKNLVDPNMSPPKLLKEVPPDPLMTPNMDGDQPHPESEDGHTHLWHPLFGSNQIKGQGGYNSPWNWTTVTVNGE